MFNDIQTLRYMVVGLVVACIVLFIFAVAGWLQAHLLGEALTEFEEWDGALDQLKREPVALPRASYDANGSEVES